MAFGWLKPKRERLQRVTIKNDHKHLEVRARRYLAAYLEADAPRKALFYKAVEDASQKCHAEAGMKAPPVDRTDAEVANSIADAAIEIVLARDAGRQNDGNAAVFVTDAFATVGVAYRRAAGIYGEDEPMQVLGTAAVHLLTIATSYEKTNHPDRSA